MTTTPLHLLLHDEREAELSTMEGDLVRYVKAATSADPRDWESAKLLAALCTGHLERLLPSYRHDHDEAERAHRVVVAEHHALLRERARSFGRSGVSA